ncbi:unnamed protein product [Gadus morhua 'NCC']
MQGGCSTTTTPKPNTNHPPTRVIMTAGWDSAGYTPPPPPSSNPSFTSTPSDSRRLNKESGSSEELQLCPNREELRPLLHRKRHSLSYTVSGMAYLKQ